MVESPIRGYIAEADRSNLAGGRITSVRPKHTDVTAERELRVIRTFARAQRMLD